MTTDDRADLLRDLWRLRGQAIAIAVVIASGVAVLVMSLSTLEALDTTTRVYYDTSAVPYLYRPDVYEMAAAAAGPQKLLFGSDYPFTTVDASIEGLFSLNKMLDGTALPRLRYSISPCRSAEIQSAKAPYVSAGPSVAIPARSNPSPRACA